MTYVECDSQSMQGGEPCDGVRELQNEVDRLQKQLAEIRGVVSRKLDGGPVLPKVVKMARVANAALVHYQLQVGGTCMVYQLRDAEREMLAACKAFLGG